MNTFSSLLRVSKESIDMFVKNLNRRVSGIRSTAVHDFRRGQGFRYLILAVLLQCFPLAVEAAPTVPGQEIAVLVFRLFRRANQ